MNNSEEEIRRIANESADKLMEHADSVQILVTFKDGENTGSYICGYGNCYARLGQIREWLTTQEQYQRNYAIRKDSQNDQTD